VASYKKVVVAVPSKLLEEVDKAAQMEKISRSEVVRQALRLYLDEKKRKMLREEMIRGYKEMAKINLNLALEGFYYEEDGYMEVK